MKNYPQCMFFIILTTLSSDLVCRSSEVTGQCTDIELAGSKEREKKLNVNADDLCEIHYATIFFTKRSSDPAPLTGLKLKWSSDNGTQLSDLQASLFKMNVTDVEDFKPLPENLLSDGIWNEVKQELSFIIHDEHGRPAPYPLQGIAQFHIVLLVSPESRKKLRQGAFSLVPSSLPDHFKDIATQKPLTLALSPQRGNQTIS